MNRVSCLACLLLLAAPATRAADGDPPCAPQSSVAENPEYRSDTILSKEGGEGVRMHVSKAMGSSDWRGDELYRKCEQVSEPCMVARVEYAGGAGAQLGVGGEAGQNGGLKKMFQELARASGHTPQEADVLAARYATLVGTYYREVPKEGGGWESEAAAIFRKHQKQLGIEDSSPSRVPSGDDPATKAKVADLQARMKAAKKRGDKAEVMRLAVEAQQAFPTQRAAEQTQATVRSQTQKGWLLYESAYTDLLTAAYRSRISLSRMCICRRSCRLPGRGAEPVE